MISDSHQIKSIVAQNCPGYNPRNSWGLMSLGNISETCDTCANFIRGKCIKDLFDDIASNITVN